MKYETVTGPFSTFYDQMKAIYDELMIKHNGDLDKVRAEMPKVNYVVGSLPPQIKEAWEKILSKEIKAKSVFFSADSLAKQLNHHPELTIKEYASVFDRMKGHIEIYKEGDFGVVLMFKDGVWYRVALKSTNDLAEVYLTSLHKLNKDSLQRARKGRRIY